MAGIMEISRKLFARRYYASVTKLCGRSLKEHGDKKGTMQFNDAVIPLNKINGKFCEVKNYFLNFEKRRFHLSSAVRAEKIITVPPFPESVTEGDLRWEKEIGDKVLTDEIVCEIETDKTSVGVPAPVAGTITERFVEDGATVRAGQKLFKIMVSGDIPVDAPKKADPPAPPTPKAKPPPAPKPPAPTPPLALKPSPASTPAPSIKPQPKPVAPPPPKASSPQPATVKAPPPLPIQTSQTTVKLPPVDPTKHISGTRTEFRVKITRMRQRIAQRLKEAQNTNAMLTTFNEIDMTSIMEFRKTYQEAFTKAHGIKLGFMSAFVKAAVYALKDQPVVNAVIDGSEIVYRDFIDISIAVATPKGLVVPIIRNVQDMSYADIEKAIIQLGEKARQGKLAIEDMDGGTFTISNGGVFGSLMGTPIINLPQSSILGMHATFERPVAIRKQVVIRPMMYVALTYDHRLIDGREAVLFLRKIKAGVEDPRIIVAGF